MNRCAATVGLAILGLVSAGCSNAPLAGTLDCLFPSKLRARPDAAPRLPTDLTGPGSRDPLPAPNLRDFGDTRPLPEGRLEGLPKIGEPFDGGAPRGGREATPTSDRMPLPAPMFDDAPASRLRER
jgi:hypothetical protein